MTNTRDFSDFDRLVAIYETASFLLALDPDPARRTLIEKIIRQTNVQEVEVVTLESVSRISPHDTN